MGHGDRHRVPKLRAGWSLAISPVLNSSFTVNWDFAVKSWISPLKIDFRRYIENFAVIIRSLPVDLRSYLDVKKENRMLVEPTFECLDSLINLKFR